MIIVVVSMVVVVGTTVGVIRTVIVARRGRVGSGSNRRTIDVGPSTAGAGHSLARKSLGRAIVCARRSSSSIVLRTTVAIAGSSIIEIIPSAIRTPSGRATTRILAADVAFIAIATAAVVPSTTKMRWDIPTSAACRHGIQGFSGNNDVTDGSCTLLLLRHS